RLPTRRNPWLARHGKELQEQLYASADKEQGFVSGPAIDEFPTGLARAPLFWKYRKREFDMEFLGGFVGVAQDARTLCLRPEIGWAVREAMFRKPEPP